MSWTEDQIIMTHIRSGGKCHICRKSHSVARHGTTWHMDHLRARARGGSDHGNNLRVACVPCNLEKGTLPARTIRARYGYKRSPLTEKEVRTKRLKNAAVIGLVGGVFSGILAKSWKVGLAGGLIGGTIGYGLEVED